MSKMTILLQGNDKYRQRRSLMEIMADRKRAKTSFFEFGSKSEGIGPLMEETRQRSIFKEEKLLIVFGLLENIGTEKEVLSLLERSAKSSEITLVLVEDKAVPKKKSLLDLIDETFDVSPIKSSKLEEWTISEFRLRGGEIDGLALKRLIEITGNDLWTLSNEIDKIIAYQKGSKASVKDIMTLVKPRIEADIFKAIDAMGERDKKKALKLIYSHLEKGDSVSYILSMIGSQFRNLNLVKNDNGTANELGLHPYVFGKTSKQARRFSKNELKEIYGRIVSSDAGIKTGKIEAETALDLFIFSL